MVDIKTILTEAIARNASDVHINVGMPPVIRKNTELINLEYPSVTNDDARKMVLSMVGQAKFEKFEQNRDLDFSTTTDEGHRFRCNAHHQRETVAISFRVIPNEIPSMAGLHLPGIVETFADMPRGLVLVTGHTGSGKSTTLAAMVELINTNHRKHIITLEDPIEYAMQNKTSMVEQREIGDDCISFAGGLRYALRQDPDIIMVGEMRDLETTSSTITAAETGHLVFSTLHTINAAQTIERIIDIYPANQQNQIRTMLANTLQAVVSQTLFRRIDEHGMVPCTEILLCNSAVRNCIRDNRIYEISNIIETSSKLGMQTMDSSIAKMCAMGYIDHEDAVCRSSDPAKMKKMLAQSEHVDIIQPLS
ncbi:MAG: type IV pilus twitching motility protein PilT [Planctomycetes bacterium]|nr:type IV pilus twitching motility protein PilT [Planctomycetota bacterium]MCK5472584.1 type IV pilus twitching motility protein PilT [Planctomycetota bacterium]